MQYLLSSLATMVFIGMLALLAQWSRKSRRAEISLLIVLVFLSLLLFATGALLGVLWVSGQMPPDVYPIQLLAVTAVPVMLSGLIGLVLCVPTLLKIVRGRPNGAFWTNPPIFLALWLFATVLLANNLVGILGFEQLNQVDAFSLGTGGRIPPVAILASQLPFVVIALLGVGAGIRRGPRETLARLGYGPISPMHVGVVVLFIVGAFALSVAADALFSQLQPELYRRVGEISQTLFDPKGLSLVSAVLFALLIGVGAGLGEETLFRGAVQPVLGIPVTSVLFASMHVQYGPSLLLGYIFLLSIGLGFLRRYINTTASFLAHAGYNTLGILAVYFFGL
ncbi:MAG TPA: CPBP family intramembrane glutamic endopeptidase [Rubrobacter sp.]|nr:CPBP family intramembrane glutamic endopeptidase [Rubrobacter sp.]